MNFQEVYEKKKLVENLVCGSRFDIISGMQNTTSMKNSSS